MATFTTTPGYTHGEELSYRVGIVPFVDLTEQRFASSAQRGLKLAYEWPTVDSGQVVEVVSFFMGYGATGSFSITDHRDGRSYMAHFAGTQLTIQRGPIDKRSLRVEFLTVDAGGTVPVAVSFTPDAPHVCSFAASSITAPGAGVVGAKRAN